MEKKQLWIVIAGLVLVNCLTIVFFLSGSGEAGSKIFAGEQETVAKIGKETISRQEWLTEMEERYGEDTLRDLIDQKVIIQMADDYGIKVSDSAIERELNMLKAMYGSGEAGNEEKWKQEIKYNLLLEELLTKDANVTEADMKNFYEQNQTLYDVPASYHLSQIVVKTKAEAEQTVKELKQGSSFSALAMERSIDEFSAQKGGDLGFINVEDDSYLQNIEELVKGMENGEWTDPVETESGYAILMVHEKLKGKKYSFEEVKGQIRRQIALEQMDRPVSARAFWSETRVDWFYEEKEK